MMKPSHTSYSAGLWASVEKRLPLLSIPNVFLRRLSRDIRQDHRDIEARMGKFADSTFIIDPRDMPFLFRIRLASDVPVAAITRTEDERADARISGSLSVLLSLFHARQDGDALFFSRDIEIEGDMEAVLALRNALDAAEIDLLAQTAALFGPFEPMVERSLRTMLPAIEALTGFALAPVCGGRT